MDPDDHGQRPADDARFAARLRERFGADADPNVSLDREHADKTPSSSGELFRRLTAHAPRPSRYTVLEEIGRGGMGAVFKARDEDLRRTLAMKVILGQAQPQAGGSTPPIEPHKLARFLEEAQVTGQLDHPGIVPVHELGIDSEGRVYFTMRLVKGRDLKQIIDLVHARAEGWTPTKALSVIIKVCEATAYAHSKGVIHRDLKPANIMVGRFGETYVMDWGLAKVLGRRDSHDLRLREHAPTDLSIVATERKDEHDFDPSSPLMTVDGTIFGTPAYMSPEQARGKLDEIGVRSDVYSVGAMLYHLLTGQMAYVAPDTKVSAHVVWKWLLDGPPQPVTAIKPDVPEELAAICAKAMAREPEQRYADTMEIADDLQAYLEGRVVRAYETGAVAEFRKWVARNKGMAWTSAAALLLLVASLGAIAYVQVRAGEELMLKNEELLSANTDLEAARDEVIAANEDLRATNEAVVVARNVARAAESEAHANEQRARLQSYVANLVAADANITANEVREAQRRLASCEPERRDWEWRHLSLAADASIARLAGHKGPLHAVAFSIDGRQIVSAADGDTLRVWNAADGKQLTTLEGHMKDVVAIAVSPDGKWIASASQDETVCLWSATTGEQLGTIPISRTIHSIAFEPRQERIAIASYSTIHLYELPGGKKVRELRGHRGPVLALAFSRDGKQLASGSTDSDVRLWNAESGALVAQWEGHTESVHAVAFDPEGEHVFSASRDESIRRWDVRASAGEELVRSIAGEITAMTVSPAGRLVYSPSDGTVRVLDGQRGELLDTIRTDAPVTCLDVSADGTRLVAGSTDHSLRIYELRTPGAVTLLSGHGAEVYFARFAPAGDLLVSGGPDSTMRMWDGRTGEPLMVMREMLLRGEIAFSPDGRRMAAGLARNRQQDGMQLWDARTGAPIAYLCGHDDSVLTCAFSADGKLLASGSTDATIRVRDADTYDPIAKIVGHKLAVRRVVFSPDNESIASCSADGTVRVWDARSGLPRALGSGHEGLVQCVAYSPDGLTLASCGDDRTVRTWNAATGAPLATLMGHEGKVTAVAYSPDGARLASSSEDKTVRLWDVKSGEALIVLRGHLATVHSVDFSPDGARLASASADRSVRIWESEPAAPRSDRRAQREALRRQALPIVERLYERWLRSEEVLKALHADFSLSAPVRDAAIELTLVRGDDKDLLNEASWRVVRVPGASQADYQQALRFAQTAAGLRPNDEDYLMTLGAAQFRVGDWSRATATLTRGLTYNRNQPAARALLAMAHHHMGNAAKVQDELARLRIMLKDERWSKDEDALAIAREAELLIFGASATPAPEKE